MLNFCAVVRDERLRSSFKTICWLNLSQQPEIMQLQTHLYKQMHEDNDKIPDKATDTVEDQLRELRKVAAKRLILIVLDGMCSVQVHIGMCSYRSTFLQICGMPSTSGLSRASIRTLLRSFCAQLGSRASCLKGWRWSLNCLA